MHVHIFSKKFQIATVSLSVSKKFKKSAKFNYSDRGVSTIATPLENKQRHVAIDRALCIATCRKCRDITLIFISILNRLSHPTYNLLK